jgi:hypothetical protein
MKGRMNGFTPARRTLLWGLLAALMLAPSAGAEPIDRMHSCDKLEPARFETQLAAQGLSCRRARALVRGWLAKSWSLAGEGLPRSTRRHHWLCRRGLAWSCAVNGRRVRIVFRLELRRTGDLVGTLKTAYGIGVAGERFVDYRVVVRNLGTDAVPARLFLTMPAGASFWGATPSQGRCHTPGGGRLQCALGSVATGCDDRAAITITMGYDCFSLDPIGPAGMLVSSIAGDLDRSNNRASVDERDRDCPDPLDTWFDEPDPPELPDPPDDPPPAPADPAPPPEDAPAPPPEEFTAHGDLGS